MGVKEASAAYVAAQDAGCPVGYKQTEVGVIPEDWSIQCVADFTTMIASGRSETNSHSGDYPVHGSTGIIGRIKKADYSGIAVLVARVGANAGKLRTVSGDYGVSDNTIIIKTSDDLHHDFFWRQLDAKNLNSLVFGSGQPLITGSQIKNIVFAAPPTRAEQEAIAKALGDTDALIESLLQLIAKKRQIKQGSMQELLTGRRRLPGFEETPGYRKTDVGQMPNDWEFPSLGEIIDSTQLGGNYQNSLFETAWPLIKMGNMGRGYISLDKL